MSTINPSLFKLRVSQSKCPIHTGQVLPLIKDFLRTNQQDSLNLGFYQVNSVSRLKSHSPFKGAKETYKIALSPVEWDPVEMSWGPKEKEGSVSPHPFDISISSEELYDHFGILTKATTTQAKIGDISKFVESLFKKAKKYNEWLDKYQNIDFDVIFRNIAHQHLNKAGLNFTKEDKEDVFHDALIALEESEAILNFDESKGSFVNFIWGVFRNYLRNAISAKINALKHETTLQEVEDGDSDKDFIPSEEQIGLRKLKESPQQTPEEQVAVTDLFDDLKKYLISKKHGREFTTIIDMLPKGYTQNEIAKNLGMSSSNVTYLIKKLIPYLQEYAEKTNNDLFLSAIKDGISRRTSSVTAKEELDVLKNIFKNYENQKGQSEIVGETKMAERVPVGETIRIKRKLLPNLEEITQKVVQDPELSTAQAKKDVEAYLQDLISSDELIESDGKIIALKVTRKE